ncbi:MAG: NAD-dependent epimerase/dehydratase family protein [Longimicrobiales bacterium]|nr:NAD-dependent epimerase/dehydratase family protein [Longimicrobiales bacterium]
MTTIALTGATGFIGRRILARLTGRGISVRALTRRSAPATVSGTTWIRGDLATPDALARLVEGSEGVIHCAGAVRGAGPADFDRVNLDGTRSVLTAAVRAGVDRFLLISSLAAREPDLSWYAASKHAAEELLEADAPSAMTHAVVRPPAVYGPGDREIAPLFGAMRRGWMPMVGAPGGRFSLLFVDDLAEAAAAWVEAAAPPGGVHELHDGTPGGYDWPGVARTAEEIWGRRIRIVRVPPVVLDLVARANLVTSRWSGRAPMLTPPKLRELRHGDWSSRDDATFRTALEWAPRLRLADALRAGLVLPS